MLLTLKHCCTTFSFICCIYYFKCSWRSFQLKQQCYNKRDEMFHRRIYFLPLPDPAPQTLSEVIESLFDRQELIPPAPLHWDTVSPQTVIAGWKTVIHLRSKQLQQPNSSFQEAKGRNWDYDTLPARSSRSYTESWESVLLSFFYSPTGL